MQKAEAALLASFEQALEEQRLRMVYQPKVALRDGCLKRVEARNSVVTLVLMAGQ